MIKKSCVFIFCIILIAVSVAVPSYAYEPSGFEITARNVVFASLDTDEVLFSKEPDQKVYPASITKIMTVTLMLESNIYNPDAKIAMTDDVLKLISGTGSSVSNLKSGEEISELDLAYLVLMASYGDCAYLAAIHYGGSLDNFVNMMNNKAKDLGLRNTHYQNPVGLHSEQNFTTANDTLKLTKYALKNQTFKKICETTRYTVAATQFSRERTISTTNFLQDSATNYYYTYAKGVKTGYTDEAGRCLVSTASYNGYNYICILFGCPVSKAKRYEFSESKDLYKWAFNNFELKEAASSKTPVAEVAVDLSLKVDYIPVYLQKDFLTVLPSKADTSTVSVKPHLKSKKIDAPIKKGDILGTADIYYAEKKLGTVNLVARDNVTRNTLLHTTRTVKRFFISKYMIFIYVIIGIVIITFIIAVIILNKNLRKRRKVKYIPYKKHEQKSNYLDDLYSDGYTHKNKHHFDD